MRKKNQEFMFTFYKNKLFQRKIICFVAFNRRRIVEWATELTSKKWSFLSRKLLEEKYLQKWIIS